MANSRGEPDGLEASAFSGVNLAQASGTPGAPMFETESLFGAHMAGLPLDLAPGDPVVVCVPLLFNEPRRPVVARARSDNAHRRLFHFDEAPGGPGSREEHLEGLTPWFARLLVPEGSGAAGAACGLGVGFSYASFGRGERMFGPRRLAGRSLSVRSRWRWRNPPEAFEIAYMDAEYAGFALAGVLVQLRARLDCAGMHRTEIDLVCHGLGARVALSALALLAQRYPTDPTITRIGRVILMGGICYWGQAAHFVANILFSEAHPRPQIFNITCQRDPMLWWLIGYKMVDSARKDAARDLSREPSEKSVFRLGNLIGRVGTPAHDLYGCFAAPYPEWIDLELGAPAIQRALAPSGLELSVPRRWRVVTHNAYWTHPANWRLIRRLTHRRQEWSVGALGDLLAERGAGATPSGARSTNSWVRMPADQR